MLLGLRALCMTEYLFTLEISQMWYLISCLAGDSVIGSKWVYLIKVKYYGSLDRYKASLIAQGFK